MTYHEAAAQFKAIADENKSLYECLKTFAALVQENEKLKAENKDLQEKLQKKKG